MAKSVLEPSRDTAQEVVGHSRDGDEMMRKAGYKCAL